MHADNMHLLPLTKDTSPYPTLFFPFTLSKTDSIEFEIVQIGYIFESLRYNFFSTTDRLSLCHFLCCNYNFIIILGLRSYRICSGNSVTWHRRVFVYSPYTAFTCTRLQNV